MPHSGKATHPTSRGGQFDEHGDPAFTLHWLLHLAGSNLLVHRREGETMSATRYAPLVSVLALVAFLCLAPCASAGDATAPVKGTITLDGKPLAGGRVFFHLGDGQFVGAKIKDGAFKVDRVPIGTHKVTVEFQGLASRYASEDKSGLQVEVRKGTNTLNFELSR
jgi:hypothetical protein